MRVRQGIMTLVKLHRQERDLDPNLYGVLVVLIYRFIVDVQNYRFTILSLY